MILAVLFSLLIIGYIWFRVVIKTTPRPRHRTFNLRKYRTGEDDIDDDD